MKDQQIVILQTEKKMLKLRAEAAEALKEKATAQYEDLKTLLGSHIGSNQNPGQTRSTEK